MRWSCSNRLIIYSFKCVPLILYKTPTRNGPRTSSYLLLIETLCLQVLWPREPAGCNSFRFVKSIPPPPWCLRHQKKCYALQHNVGRCLVGIVIISLIWRILTIYNSIVPLPSLDALLSLSVTTRKYCHSLNRHVVYMHITRYLLITNVHPIFNTDLSVHVYPILFLVMWIITGLWTN